MPFECQYIRREDAYYLELHEQKPGELSRLLNFFELKKIAIILSLRESLDSRGCRGDRGNLEFSALITGLLRHCCSSSATAEQVKLVRNLKRFGRVAVYFPSITTISSLICSAVAPSFISISG